MNNITLEYMEQFAKEVEKDPSTGLIKMNAHLEWESGTRNKIVVRDFEPIISDEPEFLGGTNKSLNPVEYLLTGAAACFSTTVELMASEQGIKLDKVSTYIETDFDFAIFFGIKDGQLGVTNLTIKLHVVSSAPIEKIKEIADAARSASVVLNSLKAKVELIVE